MEDIRQMDVKSGKIHLLVSHELDRYAQITGVSLNGIRERHRFVLKASPSKTVAGLDELLKRHDSLGVILALQCGCPTRRQITACRKILSSGRKLYYYWHKEKAIEFIDEERLNGFKRLNTAFRLFTAYGNARRYRYTSHNPADPSGRRYKLRTTLFKLRKALAIAGIFLVNLWREPANKANGHHSGNSPAPEEGDRIHNSEISEMIGKAAPVTCNPDRLEISGYGAYVRFDFWAKINSGGSYGHTCYVAKELAGKTKEFCCFMAHRYALIDEMGIAQSVLPEPGPFGDEETISNATGYYYPILLSEFKKKPPAFIYERICLGNWVSVKLSQELGIPYIVEYNGSEISMKRSFDGGGYEYESFYLDCEEAAFRQASAISVVSEIIKDDLVNRGIDERKILVNPNGVDIQAYKPDETTRKAIRHQLGWSDEHCVIGFTGTFGGWHGIDILAEAMPRILGRCPEARFLLIGDGNLKHLIDSQIDKFKLSNRVHCAGRVPQQEGARLLTACDIYVSPHNSHMVDSRFFGSPTKIFEYMAMGGGIVSTRLEQIGEVLSPAVCAKRLKDGHEVGVTDQRAVLCDPGDIEQFVDATIFLIGHPEICEALGKNARQAAVDHYSWEKHVHRLMQFVKKTGGKVIRSKPSCQDQNQHGDEFYKAQARRQWDNDPCGSHYVKNKQQHTLEWFKEAEHYRYDQYAPWMFDLMEFDKHNGQLLLEIGGGMGTDLAQYAKHGACIVDFDLAAGHLQHAKGNFMNRGLQGMFIQGDAERMPLNDNTFDVVYSNGVLHHIPNMHLVIDEIYRILKPGGLVIVMVYAENSKHYWENIVYAEGVKKGLLHQYSIGEIMSRVVEISSENNSAKPLVKVYTPVRLKKMFCAFGNIRISQCQITASELAGSRIVPKFFKRMPLSWAGKAMGWNLVIKARKPLSVNA